MVNKWSIFLIAVKKKPIFSVTWRATSGHKVVKKMEGVMEEAMRLFLLNKLDLGQIGLFALLGWSSNQRGEIVGTTRKEIASKYKIDIRWIKKLVRYGLILWKGERGSHKKTLVIPWKNKNHVQFLSKKKQAIKNEKKETSKNKKQKVEEKKQIKQTEKQWFDDLEYKEADPIVQVQFSQAKNQLKKTIQSEEDKDKELRARNEMKAWKEAEENRKKIYYQEKLTRKMMKSSNDLADFFRYLIHEYPSQKIIEEILQIQDVTKHSSYRKWKI